MKSLFFLSIIFFSNIFPQSKIKDTVIVPGPEYQAGGLHSMFFGEHWRKLWITPVQVEVLDFNKFAGGLTPYKRGGGFQTKSLRFRGGDGKIYKFRSLNKDPKKLLPLELQNTLISSVLQDQISSSHPLAPFIAAPLLNEVGVLNAQPKLVFLPDDEELKEYRNEFANLLGILEEHPDKSDDDTVGFAGADKIKSTFDLFEELEKNNTNRVEESEYLKSRLMDMLMGDWDRHVDQWRWARYKKENERVWYPIPRDRDQVFAKFDGIFPWMVELAVPQMEGFGYDYPEIEDLTWSGRFLDRRFLNRLTKEKWDSVTQFVMSKITDDVIKNAVHKLPYEWFKVCGEEIINKLISRRNKLDKASQEYYKNIFSVIDIKCSDKSEFAEILRANEKEVKISVYKRNDHNSPFYNRTFNTDETSEIRIEMMDGDDSVSVKGFTDNSIEIHVNGGEGKDIFVDSSSVSGFLFSFLPIPSAENKTIFYDSGQKSEFITGDGTTVVKRKFNNPKNVEEKYEPLIRDWGIDWKFKPVFNYTTDEGIVLGGGPVLYKFGYKIKPFVSRLQLTAGYSFFLSSYFIDFQSEFHGYNENLTYGLNMKKSELTITNYFGQGNESRLDKNLEKQKYYKVGNEIYTINPYSEYKIFSNTSFLLGSIIKYSETKLKDSTLVKHENPYGTNRNTFFSFYSGITYDSRDNFISPTSGLVASIVAGISPKILKENKETFYRTSAEIRGYQSIFGTIVFALRIRGEKIWEDYPFYESVFLGGDNSVKGYNRQRFAGNSAIEFNSELRAFISTVNIIVPFRYGISLFSDAGRVYSTGEDSKKWHPGYGGGIWFFPVDRSLTFSLIYAKSPEDFGFYFKSGFSF